MSSIYVLSFVSMSFVDIAGLIWIHSVFLVFSSPPLNPWATVILRPSAVAQRASGDKAPYIALVEEFHEWVRYSIP